MEAEATATKWDKMDGAYSVQTDTSLPMDIADQSTSSAALTIGLTVSVLAATMAIHCQEDHVSVTKAEGDGDLGTEDHTHINHSKGLPATNSNQCKGKATFTLMDSHSPTNDHYLFYYYITTLLHYTILQIIIVIVNIYYLFSAAVNVSKLKDIKVKSMGYGNKYN